MFRQRPPHPALRPYVDALWTCAVPPGGVVVPPDGCTDLMWTGRDVLFLGPARGPVSVPGGHFSGVRFKPGGAAALLGLALDGLADAVVDGPGLGVLDPALVDILAESADPLAALEAAILPLTAEATPCSLMRALDSLDPEGPLGRVQTLGLLLNTPGRSLRRDVRQKTGLAPKRLLRVLRFQSLLRLRADGPAPGLGSATLAEAAAACGYADQAHMAREVAALAGVAPSRLPWAPDWPFCSRPAASLES